jgi:phosphoribosylanthranilate isomerase
LTGPEPLWVKVCGVTSVEEALWIAALGVDAIGLNFVRESPRFVPLERAREIARALPPSVERIGVFVDAPEEEIDFVAREVGLDRLQLHGQEDPAYGTRRSKPVIKAFRPGPEWDTAVAGPWRLFPLLVDGYDPARRGGTGRTADWSAARRLVDDGFHVILAGGLHAGNLVEAVKTVTPSGVDLNSGVETAPGRKDRDLLIAALRALGRDVGK